jgi:hypothetical protein
MLWLGQQRAGGLIAVLKVLSRSAHGGTGQEIMAREWRQLIRADVSNGTEKPVRMLAG